MATAMTPEEQKAADRRAKDQAAADQAKAKAAAEKAKSDAARAKAKAERDEEREAAERRREIDRNRGYTKRTLANGTTDFVALHDQWSNPDEAQVVEHVTAYRNRLMGITQ